MLKKNQKRPTLQNETKLPCKVFFWTKKYSKII